MNCHAREEVDYRQHSKQRKVEKVLGQCHGSARLTKAVAASMVGYNQETGTLFLNPTLEESLETSQLQIMIVAGTKDA
jgi:hypothetical protein